MAEKVPNGNKQFTDRIVRWLILISVLLGIIGALGGAVVVLNTNAADIRAAKVEQVRMALEIAAIKARQELDMTKITTRLEDTRLEINPILYDIQSRIVRIETQLETVLREQERQQEGR